MNAQRYFFFNAVFVYVFALNLRLIFFINVYSPNA